jgi:cellulose synthase/poly-beta-1,6-N-acetylglucosamine synthase-like glycosyltransferase/peptidoglycan/xylan/chitin deacetylase (PgdA/CDA1 family)
VAQERSVRRYLRRPPSHWVLFAFVLAGLALALLVQGFAREEVGRSSTEAPGAPVPGLEQAGPVLDLSGPAVRSASPPARQVALTFDDGPDPRWTPLVLSVLRRHNVRATFFVVGSQVVAHPGLLRAEVHAGHEIGSHTFTHANLGAVSGIRANFELALTETALAGVAGINTSLLRLPYSSSPDSFTVPEYRAARAASRFGYLVVAADRDSEDWTVPGVDRIVANATPSAGDGAVILFHDAGGDRHETVLALDRLITTLAARGDSFVTVSELAGLPHAGVNPKVGVAPHLQGLALLAAMGLAFGVTRLLTLMLVPIGILSVLRSGAVLALARRHSRAARQAPTDPYLAPVSVIVPAYNEEVGIAAAVRSLAASSHPEFEIIVVDDGSTDSTAAVVESLGEPDVTVVRQPNGGKPSALNTGIARARHDVIVMIDGDTVFEPDTITELIRPLADPTVGAVSGNTKVGNRRGLLGRWQHVEYVIGFNLDRRMYDVLRCMPTIPGAIGAFRREALDAVGGVSDDTLAEDTDLTMAINRAGWRVVYEERARAWTEAPATLRQLWRQRYRWCYGTMQAMWKHRGAVREGTPLGRYGIPYLLFFQVMLPLLAPVIDLIAVYGLLFLRPGPVLAYWLAFNALQAGLAVYAFRLDGERLGPLWTVPLQQFVYRQLMYLVVIQSVISAVVGTRLRWHKLTRVGGLDVPTPQR